MSRQSEPEYITYAEAMQRYPGRIDQRAIRRWVSGGALPAKREVPDNRMSRLLVEAGRLAQILDVDGRTLPSTKLGVSRYVALQKPANG